MKTESQMNVVRNGLIVAALSARVSFDLATDSTGTTGKWFAVYSYRDLTCTPSERGWVVARTSHLGTAANSENLGTASFTPEAGKAYRASFAVRRQSNSCDLKIEDDSNTRVSYATPADSCYQGQLGRMRNGGGGTLIHSIQIQRYESGLPDAGGVQGARGS